MRTGRYLYGLIRSAEDQDFGAIGLEHQGKPGRVHTVQVDGVAAIVSEYPVGEKILPLRKNLGPHHRVIQEVMKTATIVPASFGHVAKSEDDVARALRRNDGAVRAELDRVDGKVEMGLKVRWDVDNIFEYFVGLDPELAAFRDEIFGRSHAPTQAEKIDLGQMFERRVAQDREDQSERVVKAFQPLFSEVKVNPPKSETCVMDLAFLVPRDGVKSFEERVYVVAGTFPAQYLFDFNGPWAPFHFVELDLHVAAA